MASGVVSALFRQQGPVARLPSPRLPSPRLPSPRLPSRRLPSPGVSLRRLSPASSRRCRAKGPRSGRFAPSGSGCSPSRARSRPLVELASLARLAEARAGARATHGGAVPWAMVGRFVRPRLGGSLGGRCGGSLGASGAGFERGSRADDLGAGRVGAGEAGSGSAMRQAAASAERRRGLKGHGPRGTGQGARAKVRGPRCAAQGALCGGGGVAEAVAAWRRWPHRRARAGAGCPSAWWRSGPAPLPDADPVPTRRTPLPPSKR
ncbi:hypothetical protein HNR30_008386 [Nonomuraea soli]|uniref:Uncharacterized protein n=1 Tax=Nonomuraea soli TaxID=1032476 RepID=A0A7W0CTS1_9ACTN|nr:hypothetical protein [Nonomuraea soli]